MYKTWLWFYGVILMRCQNICIRCWCIYNLFSISCIYTNQPGHYIWCIFVVISKVPFERFQYANIIRFWKFCKLLKLCYRIYIFTHVKLRLAAATHNFKRVKISHIRLIWANICKSNCDSFHSQYQWFDWLIQLIKKYLLSRFVG